MLVTLLIIAAVLSFCATAFQVTIKLSATRTLQTTPLGFALLAATLLA